MMERMSDLLKNVKAPSRKQFSFRRSIKNVGIALVCLYLAAVTYLYVAQRRLMYFPFGENPKVLAMRAEKEGFTAWTNAQGGLMGWIRTSRVTSTNTRAVLVFHGNAGSAVDRTFLADTLQGGQDLDVYLVEYPGYGGRPGIPTEESLFAAAREAFDAVATKGKVYLVGESLGTGVASHLAGTCSSNVAGVFLIAPFNNFAAAARSHYPIFPTSLILKDRYASDVFLRSYTGPLAVILAGHDEVVPNHLGRKLFDGYAGPKKLWVNETASHNSLSELNDTTWLEVLAFFAKSR
jgi:alpha-beta hydrolase superfamily lysophospholipase